MAGEKESMLDKGFLSLTSGMGKKQKTKQFFFPIWPKKPTTGSVNQDIKSLSPYEVKKCICTHSSDMDFSVFFKVFHEA